MIDTTGSTHFVTGKLAAPMLREILRSLAERRPLTYTVEVLPIRVAALMTPAWIARHVRVPPGTRRIVIPGDCGGDLQPLHEVCSCPVEVGPKDLLQLPRYLERPALPTDLEAWDIEILAEINRVPRLAPEDILALALQLQSDGADLIDLGCEPGRSWPALGDCVRQLRDEGLRVSVDSMDSGEIAAAAAAGAELVLSVDRSNIDRAAEWGCEVVVIPDRPGDLDSLERSIDRLSRQGVPFRLDPILDPIGTGFAGSLLRYAEVRRRWPDAAMLMGVGNLTEMSEVDSAGINLILAAICQEWSIDSVLTTQVIPWARTSVRELDRARRAVRYALQRGVPPKHIETGLVALRDPDFVRHDPRALAALAAQLRDENFRIYLSESALHLLGGGRHEHGVDPFAILDRLRDGGTELDAAHAFYLGFELCKAALALQLGKDYRQDEPLRWGCATPSEPPRHRLKKRKRKRPRPAP